MYPEQNETPAQIVSQPPKPVFSPVDSAYAWISLLLAFLFCQATPVTEYPLGGFLTILIMFVSGFVILRFKKRKLYPVCILSALSSLVIGSALLLTDTVFLINLSMAYCLASYSYFLYAALGNRIEEGFSDYIYIDFIKILFLLPFRSITAIFPALSNKATKKGSQLLGKILLGIGIGMIPTVLVFSFLAYDSAFTEILGKIFSFDEEDVGRTMLSMVLALPLGMYSFGLYASADRKFLQASMTAQRCKDGLQKAKILPQLTALVAVVPMVFLYVVFFISQWQYYVSGFTGTLPQNFSYAEYARQGFFELCSVSVINLILIIAIAFFIKRNQKNSSVILKIVAAVFCVCTLILISTAVAKLIMYIQFYGLTQKRIYAMWLMVLIGIVFLVIALGQFLRKIKVVATCLTVAILLFAALSVCNVNAMCANYNAERYLSGSLETLDVAAMKELGDSAIPSLVKVAKALDPEKDASLKKEIDKFLDNKYAYFALHKFSVFSFSIPSAMAKAALEEYAPDYTPKGIHSIERMQTPTLAE